MIRLRRAGLESISVWKLDGRPGQSGSLLKSKFERFDAIRLPSRFCKELILTVINLHHTSMSVQGYCILTSMVLGYDEIDGYQACE